MQSWDLHGEDTGGYYECKLVTEEKLQPDKEDLEYFKRIETIVKGTKYHRDKITVINQKIDALEDYLTQSSELSKDHYRFVKFSYQTIIRYYDILAWFEVGRFYNPLYEIQDEVLKTRFKHQDLETFLRIGIDDLSSKKKQIILPIYDWALKLNAVLETFY